MGAQLSRAELAEAAGVSPQRLGQIDKALPEGQKLFLKTAPGKYDLNTFFRNYIAYRMPEEDEDTDLDAVKAKHEAVKMQKTQLEVERMEGELIALGEIKRLWGDVANSATQSFLNAAAVLAPLVQGMTDVAMIQDIIDREIRMRLENLSRTPLPAYALDNESGDEE
jgi:transcriptional regulator with XRE-family HTH domain